MQSEKIMIRVSRQDIIAKHSSLFWYTPEAKKQDISDSLLVETILNYGTLDEYRELVAVLGGKRVAEVFFFGYRTAKVQLLSRDLPFLFISPSQVCTRRFSTVSRLNYCP